MKAQCKVTVSRFVGPSRCERPAKRDGYCTQHHPDTLRAKHAARDELLAAERELREAQEAIEDLERAIVATVLLTDDSFAGDHRKLKDAEAKASERYRAALEKVPRRGLR